MKKLLFFVGFVVMALTCGAETLKLTNVVCFVKFSDQAEKVWYHEKEGQLTPPYTYYATFFNDTSVNANSVRNYFRTMSYGRVDWVSEIVQLEYIDDNPSGYYKPYSETNKIGYDFMEAVFQTRFGTLVRNVCKAVDEKMGEDAVLDGNGDGEVDNVTIIINGSSAISSSQMLWPQNKRITNAEIKGVKVGNVLRVFDGYNGYKGLDGIDINTGVVCHELMHTQNAYDLYTSESSPQVDPVNMWDLMCDNKTVPQSLTAYMRNKYSVGFGEWIKDSEITELAENGTYTVKPVNSPTPDNVVYKIAPDKSRNEFFMIEYRDRDDMWDLRLPADGILVYRINPDVKGNLGKKQEVYIFRPDGLKTTKGNINLAPLGDDTARFSFGAPGDSDYPYYSDGTKAGFFIYDVKKNGNGMEFTLNFDAESSVGEIGVEDVSGEKIIYNLQGQRMKSAEVPGIYIINGKKVMVR